jgi:L-alanine-DL-glutamate epimerase-like enolase superfamily enzyme
MTTYDLVRDLPLTIESVELGQLATEPRPDFRRLTTVISLRGGGHEGVGEDITYQPEEHESPPVPDVAGSWTLDSLSQSLDGARLFTHDTLDSAAHGYRRWGWESAALDLALRQAGRSLAEVLGRYARPVRYVVSCAAEKVPRLLELYPALRFKLDPSAEWSDELIDELAALSRVETADFKGVFRGDFGNPPDARLYARIAEAFPRAWLEDPGLDEETDEVLRPYRERITWDAPVHSVAEAEALPFPPRCLNCKPSRFGSVERLFAFYDWCDERGVALYGGGQWELGPGRGQIQLLAALFHPDAPNDVAPVGFNEPEPRAGLPESPLLPQAVTGFRLA